MSKKFIFDVPYKMYDRFIIEADSINEAVTQLWYGLNTTNINETRLKPDEINVGGEDEPTYDVDAIQRENFIMVEEIKDDANI